MFETGVSRQRPGLEEMDSLFLGSAALEDAGYHSLSRKPSEAFHRAFEEDGLEPGLLHYMAVCLPFKRIYTHGNCGIIQKAKDLVNREAGPTIVPLAEKEPDNIEYLQDWQQLMVKETPPVYNAYYPQHLLIASIDRNYDAGALDELLFDCQKNNPEFRTFLFAEEPLEPEILNKYRIKKLKLTWEDYLDSREFREYYENRLARLFKEYCRWPSVPGFTGRKQELAALDRAVQRFSFVQVDGGVGVGKSALLAQMADRKAPGQKIVWIHADSRFISKAEVILSMAIQLELLSSPKVLEEKNLKDYIPELERLIEKRLGAREVLIIFDSLDPYLKQGWQVFENKELQDLLSRWVTDRNVLGKSKLVFTADLRMKDPKKDPFKHLKTSLTNAVRNREQKLVLKPMEDSMRWELFLKWLNVIPGGPGFQKQAYRLYKIEKKNLRLLRLLALWACEAGDISKLEENIIVVEEAKPWEKEQLVYRYLFETIGSQKQVILKTLEWIGRPVLRTVICSSAGMGEALDELIEKGLVILNKEDKTVEPVYRFGKKEVKEAAAKLDKTSDNAVIQEIRALRRMGEISGKDTVRAVDFYSEGNSIVEVTGRWEEWADAPLINLSGFLSKAEYLLKQAKRPKTAPSEREALAQLAVHLGTKSIDANIDPGQSHFVCAQAMSLAFPRSHEDEIQRHYEKSIAIHPRSDKHGRYAIFIYKRLGIFEDAEQQFKKARELEAKKNYLNITGLNAQAEFYLHWDGHERESGNTINRIINLKKSEIQNYFLAARLFQKLKWKFLNLFFFEASLAIESKNIQVLNSYGNACVEWGDKNKAIDLFEKALEIQSENIQVLNSYGNACVEWGDKNKAIELFEKSLSIDPKHVPTLNSYGNACVEWGDKNKAIDLFEKSLSIDPKHVPALNSYANAYVEWGNKNKAIELFEKALEIQSENIQVLNSYGNACVEWGNKNKAIELFEKSISIDSKHIPTLTSYGIAHERWGDKEKGRNLMEKAKDIKSKESPAAKTGIQKETGKPSTSAVIAPTKEESELPQEIKEQPVETVPMAAKTEPQAEVQIPLAPGTETPTPFNFNTEEKAWLTSFKEKELSWTGSKKWAGFGMLYTLYYLEGELNSAADLGYIPSMERDYRRLFNTVNDLYQMMRKATYKQQESLQQEPVQWKEEWFQKEGKPFDLIAYFDGQILTHPQNPVCAAFLCQALEAYSWGNIAAEVKKNVSVHKWVKKEKKEWQRFMSKSTVNLFTSKGKKQFLSFLEDQNIKKEKLPEQVEPVSEKAVGSLISRFSVTWEDMPKYFPWLELNPDEETNALNKLLSLVEKLKNILKDIMDQKTNAFQELKAFTEKDLTEPVLFMDRLDEYADELDKPEPIPWYVSGEILEIKENTLRVLIERSGEEDEEREIPKKDFPEENPQVGQLFFAKIDEDRPEVVYGINPLPPDDRTFDEIFIELFGKKIYEIVSARWEKQDS
jgi:tetratricopeptide (TPR) repeat protein